MKCIVTPSRGLFFLLNLSFLLLPQSTEQRKSITMDIRQKGILKSLTERKCNLERNDWQVFSSRPAFTTRPGIWTFPKNEFSFPKSNLISGLSDWRGCNRGKWSVCKVWGRGKIFKWLSAGLQQHQSRSHQKISYGKVKRRRKEMVSVAAENLPGIGDLQI